MNIPTPSRKPIPDLLRFRGFIISSVQREFQAKYRNSLLGVAWMVINPLALILIYTVVFSQVMQARIPATTGQYAYSIYLCSGILTWGLFSEIVMRSQSVYLDNANLLKKLSFPKSCLNIIVVLSALLNFSIVFLIFMATLLVTHNFPGLVALAVLPVLLIQVAFSWGLGMVLGVLNVFFRDVGQLFGVAIQFWFWLTPIVYPSTVLPEPIKLLMPLNPMASLTGAYQQIFAQAIWPEWSSLVPAGLAAVAMCALGITLLQRHSGAMVDEL